MPRQRVAIIGASGIGRHHANWWQAEGAEVCAFAGRTERSVAATQAQLAALFGFGGRGYTDATALLATERPDIVDVCSPPECHAEHVRLALTHGCDVLCEKPFIYDPAQLPAAWLAQATALATLAEHAGHALDLCTQYAMAARLCMARRPGGANTRVHHFEAVLRAPARGRQPNPRFTWIDLGPHLLGALQIALPGAEPDWDTLLVTAAGHDVSVRCEARTPNGERVPCQLEVGFTVGEPSHTRRLVLDGEPCDVRGENGRDGYFRARLVGRDWEDVVPDTLRLLIRAFLAGEHLLPARQACRNLDWAVRVWQQLDKTCAPNPRLAQARGFASAATICRSTRV